MISLVNYISESSDEIKISDKEYTTADIIKICKKLNFKLFNENFEKNNGTFPYIKADKVKYVVAVSGKNIAAILAYGDGKDVNDRWEDDNEHQNFAYIFDLETLDEYRGKGIATILINEAVTQIKSESSNRGCALQGIDKKTAEWYYKKFGFTPYENGDSPRLSMKF